MNIEWIIILGFVFVALVWFIITERIRNFQHSENSKFENVENVGECIFCGRKGSMTKQHVWPNWLRNHINKSPTSKRFFKREGLILNEKNEIDEYNAKLEKQGHVSTHKLRIVCQRCNNGWMSRIENSAKEIITSLLFDEPVLINQLQQKLLIKWATLATIIAEYDDPRTQTIKKEDRRRFMLLRRPSHNWKIWICKHHSKAWDIRFKHLMQRITFLSSTRTYIEDKQSVDTQYTILSLGKFLVFTTTTYAPNFDQVFEGPYSEYMIQLFPGKFKSIDWSEVKAMPDQMVNQLIDYFKKKHFPESGI